MNHLFKYAIPAVCICVIVVYLVVFTIINFFGFEQFCTPDMYSDTYVARLMWQEKTLFPDGWVFGNQFYVFATPVVAALFFGFCGSANLATALATTFMTGLVMLSFWWMVKPFASWKHILLGTAVLLGSILGPQIETTIEGQILYIMASYYSSYLITLFVVFGMYARARCGEETGYGSLALAMVLSFCTGMQSLRQTAVMIVPLVGLEGIRALIGLFREKKLLLDGAAWRALACSVTNLLGIIAIRLLDPNAQSMFDSPSITTLDAIGKSLYQCMRSMRSITGLKYLNAETPILGILACVFVTVVLLGLIPSLVNRCARGGLELLTSLFALSVVSVLAVCVAINFPFTRSIYFFPWYAMPALAAMVLLNRFSNWRKGVIYAVMISTVVCNWFVSYLPTAKLALEKPEHPNREIAQFLIDEGYTHVYGDWYGTSCIAAWTDGQVNAGVWFNGVCKILPYINVMNIYSEEDNDKAAYLVTQGDEPAFLDRAQKLGANVELVTQFQNGYQLYISDIQMMYHPEQ